MFGRMLSVLLPTALLAAQEPPRVVKEEWVRYWHAGKAEITRYDLTHHRYGEPRQGDAVLIFVTEDLRSATQVKAELPGGGASVPVLKLNEIRRFVTGIYDYSLMRSVFTPTDPQQPATEKVTASVQDWCGHVWLQANRTETGYCVTGHSYFEQEGEQKVDLPDILLEDELPVRARLGLDRLPVGELKLLPGAFFLRLQHRPIEAVEATATLQPLPQQEPKRWRYEVRQAKAGRVVAYEFAAGFPHALLEFWEYQQTSFGEIVTVHGVACESKRIDYWNHNQGAFRSLREELGLK